MNTHTDKTQENKSHSVSAAESQKHSGDESTFQLADNRPEAVAQRNLQEMAKNSPQVVQAAQLQAMAEHYSAQHQHLIQRKENHATIQLIFDGDLKDIKDIGSLNSHLKAAGYPSLKPFAWFNNTTLKNIRDNKLELYADIDVVANKLGLQKDNIEPVALEAVAEKPVPKPAEEPGSAASTSEKAKAPPQAKPPLEAIAKVSDEAQKEALAVVSKVQEAEKEPAMPRHALAKKSKKQHTTVKDGGKQMIINFVWLGNRKFGPLEKFNLYSWRALGHIVNIYSYPFAGVAPHTLASLGLEDGDAELVQLKDILNIDDQAVGAANPKAALTDARSLLTRWLGEIPKETLPTGDHIFNMVDLTKSYIGGTRQGIVMDVKVGPSVHLQDYAESFSNNLISYTRGGNTPELPENQSIGTMQESEKLRLAYATAFNAKIKGQKFAPGLLEASATDSWFNQLTKYHGKSYQDTKQWLDVATMSPTGKGSVTDPVKGYDVSEPGPLGQGPFRVFKRATDQTNKAGLKTKPTEVKNLAEDVYKDELATSGGDQTFIDKALAAQGAMPTTEEVEEEARKKKEAEGK